MWVYTCKGSEIECVCNEDPLVEWKGDRGTGEMHWDAVNRGSSF